MNKFTAVLCLSMAAASVAAAQSGVDSLKLVDAGHPPVANGGVYVGNYTGAIKTAGSSTFGPNITINCVDFFNEVNTGDVWGVTAINLGSGDFSGSYYHSQTNYQNAAFLSTFFDEYYLANNTAQIASIQHAIWNIVDGKDFSDASFWTDCVAAGSCEGKSLSDVNYNNFELLHPTGSHGQEMLTTTSTPEPSSVALLGTGLIGLVPMIRRRRKA